MSAEFAAAQIQRGLHLLNVQRFAEAEAAFKEALSSDPDNDFALYQLAFAQWQQSGRERDALKTIQEAVRVAPNESNHHALAALIKGNVETAQAALPHADEAIRLDPTSPFAFYARAQLLLAVRRLPEAEAAARSALEHDPSHSGAQTVLSHALRMQGRVEENAAQIAGMLERDPEDDDHHAAAGWNALQSGDYAAARTHFREAMRLNPENEFAREGLIEAFRAKSSVYRLYLRWVLWMQSKSDKFQWAVIIGLYLLMRFSRKLFTGEMAPFAGLVVGFYFLFVLWMHVARGVGNFMLLTDPFARLALRRSEKWEAWFVGGFIAAAIPLGILGAFLGLPLFQIIAATLLAAAIPFAHTFTNRAPAGRWIFGAIGAFVLCIGALVAAAEFVPGLDGPGLANLVTAAIILAVASTWLSNWRTIHR